MALLIRMLLATLLALAAGLAPLPPTPVSWRSATMKSLPMTRKSRRPPFEPATSPSNSPGCKPMASHPVSVDQILAARDGGPPLPPNAILLTFDDGMKNVYTW